MDTNTLLEILSTRIKANDNNPTRGSLLYELVNALKKLKEYESNDRLSERSDN